jgi:hypothetical protein
MPTESEPIGLKLSGDDLRRLARIESMLEELVERTDGASLPDEAAIEDEVRKRRGPPSGRGPDNRGPPEDRGNGRGQR